MNPSDVSPRRRRTVALNPEFLETRQLLTGGAGNTFAIMQATVQNPNQRVAVPFTLSQNLVTTPHNQIVLGLDIAKGTNSTIQPRIVALQDLTTKKMIPLTRTHYTAAVAKAPPTQGSGTARIHSTSRQPIASASPSTEPSRRSFMTRRRRGASEPTASRLPARPSRRPRRADLSVQSATEVEPACSPQEGFGPVGVSVPPSDPPIFRKAQSAAQRMVSSSSASNRRRDGIASRL
jgi:hypothetical protein